MWEDFRFGGAVVWEGYSVTMSLGATTVTYIGLIGTLNVGIEF